MSASTQTAELVEDMAREEIGSTAGAILKMLRTSGNLSLKEISEKLSGSPTPEDVHMPPSTAADYNRQLRGIMARLLVHNYVSFDSDDELYRMELGTGLVRAMFPLVIHHIQKQFGEAEAAVASTLQQHGSLAADVLLDMIKRRSTTTALVQGTLTESSIRAAIQQLLTSGYLTALVDTKLRNGGGGGGGGGSGAPVTKRQRTEDNLQSNAQRQNSGSTTAQSAPLELNYIFLLSKIRTEIAEQILSTTHKGNSVTAIVKCLLKSDSNRQPSKPEFPNRELPVFPLTSSPVALGFIQRTCPQIQPTMVGQTLSSLCSVEGGEVALQRISSSTATGGGIAGGGSEYMLNYAKIYKDEKLKHCESLVTGRFGSCGLRIVRLLLEKQALDERQIAEETLTALGDVRNVLTQMFKEGFLQQVELPKVHLGTADRNFKNSIFLWKLSEAGLFRIAGDCVAKVARNLYAKVRFEEEQLSGGKRGQLDAALISLGLESADPVQQRMDEQRNMALSSALFATLNALFVLNFC